MLTGIQLYLLARTTFTEAVRQKFFHFILVLGVVLLGSTQLFRQFNFGSSELKFIFDFGSGGIWLFGSILAVIGSVQLFFSELDQRTALTLLAKPLPRVVFLLGKYLGVCLLLTVYMMVMTAVLAAVLLLREQALSTGEEERLLSYSGLWVYALLQCVRLYLVAAMSFLIVCVSRTYLYGMVVAFVVLMVSQLEYIAREQVEKGAAEGVMQWLMMGVAWLFPNMQLFQLGDVLVLGMGQSPGAEIYAEIIVYGLLYLCVYLGVGAWVFRQREL